MGTATTQRRQYETTLAPQRGKTDMLRMALDPSHVLSSLAKGTSRPNTDQGPVYVPILSPCLQCLLENFQVCVDKPALRVGSKRLGEEAAPLSDHLIR
jgi:hypothetical protein